MGGQKGKQAINCTVNSCSYNDVNGNACTLDGIQVSPCSHVHNGSPEDESMCSSYQKKS
ncbi:hypothetical protein SYNTR_1428 [Candidatus Syntrophocurvum alkaliphilum]|uniref:DUF1540 domain-containing protein n=1 Tax=Candidatus Syntrophocurvum alkaliphilum TaxID=2293317 RepID=A0A6I6DLH5_9FIRM|nr:DUF1540 domain-containing protein [Candidatus Syntrophocurvum alkaliphilum]QGU00022.1 hypothetical protein SYNTR_1428 [Candidatus Syntrophocurvum alkaliphilum]